MNETASDLTQHYETFIEASQYTVPTTPTDHVLRQFLLKLKKRFEKAGDIEKVSNENLKASQTKLLDKAAKPPAYGFVLEELDITLKDWRTSSTTKDTIQLILLPPGDGTPLLEVWAKREGALILETPKRKDLLEEPYEMPSLDGEGLLVIPRLEDWFIRHRNGLSVIRNLLNTIRHSDRKIIIGCNQWAWSYLRKSVCAHHYLPEPITFKAFSAERLEAWFEALSHPLRKTDYNFRRYEDAKEIFTGDDASLAYFKTLAGASRGVPWTAWSLWRGSFRIERTENESPDETEETVSDKRVIWVTDLEAYALPGHQSDASLLVLHAVLLHSTLSEDDLLLILPKSKVLVTLPLLVKAGLVAFENGQYAISAAAYPSIRRGLKTAGFPLDGVE